MSDWNACCEPFPYSVIGTSTQWALRLIFCISSITAIVEMGKSIHCLFMSVTQALTNTDTLFMTIAT